MARYFFNIYDGKDIFDDVGSELASLKEVHRHMLASARVWIEDEGHQHVHWKIEARDEHGKLIALMKFGVEPNIDG